MKHFIIVLVLFILAEADREPWRNGIAIHAGGGVEYVVVDPLQRREGVDPITHQRYREINNSYGDLSVDSEDPDVDPPEPVNEFMTDDPVVGIYRLTLFGTKLARYRLSILVDAEDKGKAVEIFGTIDSGQARLFTFEYVNDSTAPLIVKKAVSGSNLREDLVSCFKLKFLGNRSLYKELAEHIDHIEKRLDNKDSSGAFAELEKLVKELKKAREETEKHEERKRRPNRFVTLEAYQILTDDISILMSSIGEHHRKDRGREDKRR